MKQRTMLVRLRAPMLCLVLCAALACDEGDDGLEDAAVDSGMGDFARPDGGDEVPDAATEEPRRDAGTPDDPELDGGMDPQSELAIIGDYVDGWGGVHRIDADAWITGWAPDAGTFVIAQYDNAAGFLVAHNAADNLYNPGLWSRFDWAYDDVAQLRFCQVAFAADTEQAALDTPAADAADFEAGCGGFSWSTLTPGQGAIAIGGDYVDEWGGVHRVAAGTWTLGWTPDAPVFLVSQFSNAARRLIARNGAANLYNPGLWSRFDWAWDDAGTPRFCQVAYAADSEQAALDSPAADSADFDAGCGGFSWSTLTPGQGPIAIVGEYQQVGGGATHSVGELSWTRGDGSVFNLSRHDNAMRFAVAQNDAGNAVDGELWSRFDWTWDANDALWVCHTAAAAADEMAAVDSVAADATDPAAGGCLGGPWTELAAAP